MIPQIMQLESVKEAEDIWLNLTFIYLFKSLILTKVAVLV